MKIVLIDRDEQFLNVIGTTFTATGFTTVASRSLSEALEHIKTGADCIVLETSEENRDERSFLSTMQQLPANVPVIFTQSTADLPLAVIAMQDGAAYVIEKRNCREQLEAIVRSILHTPQPVRIPRRKMNPQLSCLSPRERQVFDLVCSGQPNKGIARQLGISVKTVELHRANLTTKLGKRSVPDMVRLCLGFE